MKRIPQPFGRKVWGYRSSDEEIQGSVWHFPFPSVEESKTTAGRTRHRNRYIDGNKPSRPLRIAAKSAVEESGSFLEQVSTTVPKSAILRFCPSRETCWGVPSPNPAYRPRGLHIIYFRASAKVHSFRRSSSPHATRFAGLARGPHERRPRKEVTLCERNTTHPTAAAL